jgi:signal transduction histidine kinase/CheY-like chemotaxis protein
VPSEGGWRELLERVSLSYQDADRDKVLLERSLALSSEEMRQALYESRALNAALEDSTRVLENARLEASWAKVAAEAASRAKSHFLANMSHEIRTPMTAILGFAELIEGASDSDRRACVETILRSGRHLLGVINDILDVSKIEAGRMTIEHIECSPAAIVRELVALIRPRLEAKGLTMRMRCEQGVPETIVSDPTRIRQIASNLLDNAVKFTEKGEIEVSLRCGSRGGWNAGHIEIVVKDSGVGMTSEQMLGIFSPFVQADTSTTRRYGGSGLGLVICKHLAELMGGSLTVVSKPGEGSTFVAAISLGGVADVPKERATPRGEVRSDSGCTHALKGARVLLAEDGIDNQRLVSFHLRRAGALVEIAPNGRNAVELALRSPSPDLILMDMQMPEMDGYAATALLRERGFRGPIIALTAHAMEGDRARCIEAGCDEFATKPFESATLLSTCDRVLRETAGTTRG